MTVGPESPAPPASEGVGKQRQRQIHLSGTIEFSGVVAHKGRLRLLFALVCKAPAVSFARRAEAIAVCRDAAERYAQMLDAAGADWAHPLKLYIEGHTSSEPRGHADACRVSKARAELCATHVRQRLTELHPGCLARLRLRGLVVAVGCGAARPLPAFSDGQNHKQNRRVEMHVRASESAPPVGRVALPAKKANALATPAIGSRQVS